MNMKSKKKLSLVSVLLAAPLMLAAPICSADTIDVGVVVDKKVVETNGREWVDAHLAVALKTSNAVLDFAGLDHRRVIRNVIEVDENNAVSIATLGSSGALGGANAVCDEVLGDSRFDNMDNILWIVPESGNSSRIGNTSYCISTDHHVAVVATNYNGNLGHLIAHEFGHNDGLKHDAADEVYANTGEVLLMSNYLSYGLGDSLLSNQDVTELQQGNLVADGWPKLFSEPRPNWPSAIGTLTLDLNGSSIDTELGVAEFTLKLDGPLSEDSSFEFFTQEITAKPSIDYQEHVTRYDLLAGQDEIIVNVDLITTAERYDEKTFNVGVRYGDVITTDDSTMVKLAANSTSGDTGTDTDTGTGGNGDSDSSSSTSSGGSGGGSMNWFALLFLVGIGALRKKVS